MEAAEIKTIEELIKNHFASLARQIIVESYGVGDDARIMSLMVKIRLLMKHHEMEVAISRCIGHRLKVLKASRQSKEYSHPFLALL